MENSPERPSAIRPAGRRRRLVWGVCALGAALAAVAAAVRFNRAPAPRHVGNQACVSCHAPIVESYARTAHARTSSPPTAETMLGEFGPGRNVMHTANPGLFFRMDSDGRQFTQTAVFRSSSGEESTQQARIDIIIGSGRKGQTYLHWQGDELCQLPVTYWAEHGKWVNSPGYKDGTAKFDRPIPPRCLECHATTVEAKGPPANLYKPSSLVLGLSCEKCHGPGEEHVRRYRSDNPPRSVEDSAILNPRRLSRDRQMDLCGLCHAGEGRAITPPLTYRPGDVLAELIHFPPQPANKPLDVHASQIQLLQRSRCYQQSASMSCATCHNVHRPQRDPVSMARQCLECHQAESCGKFATLGHAIAQNCVTCHMPLEQTSQIVISDREDGTLRPKVRNHRIAVYPEVTQQWESSPR